MSIFISDHDTARRPDSHFSLRLTPAEWRLLLEDSSFLTEQDNSYLPPRRLMGIAVEIIPDHQFGW
jgi:hypothetical protein